MIKSVKWMEDKQMDGWMDRELIRQTGRNEYEYNNKCLY